MVVATRTRIIDVFKRDKAAGGVVPSIDRVLKKAKTNRAAFYSNFPHGLAQACKAAGVRAPRDRIKVGQNLKVIRESSKIRKEEPSPQPTEFDEEVEDYFEKLENLYLNARWDPEQIPPFALEVLPQYDFKLWYRFSQMSAGKIYDAYREAVNSNGKYIDWLKIEISHGKKPKDNYRKFLDYVVRITNLWLEEAISNRRGASIPPFRRSGACPQCREEYTESNGTVKCLRCKGYPSCTICNSPFRLIDARNNVVRCVRCGFEGWFDTPIQKYKAAFDLLATLN